MIVQNSNESSKQSWLRELAIFYSQGWNWRE